MGIKDLMDKANNWCESNMAAYDNARERARSLSDEALKRRIQNGSSGSNKSMFERRAYIEEWNERHGS